MRMNSNTAVKVTMLMCITARLLFEVVILSISRGLMKLTSQSSINNARRVYAISACTLLILHLRGSQKFLIQAAIARCMLKGPYRIVDRPLLPNHTYELLSTRIACIKNAVVEHMIMLLHDDQKYGWPLGALRFVYGHPIARIQLT